MRNIVKLMADYDCFPLWRDGGEIGNVNPDDLPLSVELKTALGAWAKAYDKTLNHEYPPDSGFANPTEEAAFEADGRRLWKELQVQLGPAYKVVYHSSREGRLLD